MKRREAKSKEEKVIYTYLNAVFQRIARRNKRTFLSDQYKQIEENNKMGKSRDLFKKTRDTNEHFMKEELHKEQKWYGPNRSRVY